MPEGNAVHRTAGVLRGHLGGRVLAASSPQGRFAAGASLLEGLRLVRSEARGKHLFLGFAPADAPFAAEEDGSEDGDEPPRWLHVHLGLYGTWRLGTGEPPEPVGALRLRLVSLEDGLDDPDEVRWADLRGPTACEVVTPEAVDALAARLGPDPLLGDDPAPYVERVRGTRTTIAALLMHQDVISGLGNIYRAEALFRARVHPYAPGREVPEQVLLALWEDVSVLMRQAVRQGRIVTTEPADRHGPGPRGREGDHYVYRRAGLPCRICGTPVSTAVLEARNLFWCPTCQAA